MDIDATFQKIKEAALTGRDLKKIFSGESPAGQFRVVWLRRILVTAWFIAAFVLALNFALGLFLRIVGQEAAYRYGYLSLYLGSFSFLSFLFDFWAALGLFFLHDIWKGRASGNTSPVKAWEIFFCIALVMGRTTGFFWSFFLPLIPASGWFFFLWPVKYILLPPLVLLWGGAVNMLTLYFFFAALVLAVVVLPLKVFVAAAEIMNHLVILDKTATPFFGAFVRFWFWFTGRNPPVAEYVPDDTKGARFATPKEASECNEEALKKENRLGLGKRDGKAFFLETEKHVLIMASTRSGKGVSLIIPHLLRYKGSAFVLDPKGENARATGRQRMKLNDEVHYLDPFGITGIPQSRFNPLCRFTPQNMEEESKALAAALVLGEGGDKRDHWTAAGQQLLAALILYVYASPDFKKKEKDLPTVRRLLLGGIQETLESMAVCDLADGLLSDLAVSFLNTPKREFGSIVSTAQRETEILDNPYIVRCLSASAGGREVDFSAWRKGTMTVYLCLSAPKFPVFNRWLRLVLTAALNEMTDTLKPPPVPVCFMLDELATLGHLAVIENAVGLAAGYGVQLFTVFQDVAQMKDLYKGRWASFIGNAGVRALFNLDDYDTAQYWSKFMGSRLVETTNIQQDVHGLSKGQSKGEAMRPLLTPEEIMFYFAGETNKGVSPRILVLSQGAHPIVTERVAYYDDPDLKGLWDDPRWTKNSNNSRKK